MKTILYFALHFRIIYKGDKLLNTSNGKKKNVNQTPDKKISNKCID